MQTSKESKNKNVFVHVNADSAVLRCIDWRVTSKDIYQRLTECKWGNNSCAEMLTSGDLKSGRLPPPLQDINPLINTNGLSPQIYNMAVA